MWYWGSGWSHPLAMWLGGVVILLLLVAIATGIAVVTAVLARRTDVEDERSAGLTILEQRYAKGEIRREEYVQKVKDLVASH